jgi:3-hydroxyisobutyrate dehydrogenase-like beta-hydroxyacid dehydrogenase
MRWADSPKDVGEAADVILSMVSNDAALLDVADGPNGLLSSLKPNQLWVDMSTVSATTSRSLVEKVRERGADMVDAPVSGSTVTLKKGDLLIMVGGRAATFERLKPLLLDIGRKVIHVGDNGNGLICKIATNLSLAVQMLAYSEGILLAEKSGIPREVAVEVLSNGVIASPMVQYRSTFVLKLPDEALFNVNIQQKDMLLALELGRKLNVPLPTTSVTNEFLTAARGMGLADKDFSVVFNVLARLSGVEAGNL